ncbi:hypothetical protein [Streptomyces sp. NPDC092370]|uniref:hypothetical protein n=1 Tax=Streptomyces sp. NPDC092370 TaxID=3366016 RepID=UPI0038103C4D
MNRPAVFAVTLPGATELRLETEAEVRRRGWPGAGTPAAADLLVVCGVPAPEDAAWLDRMEWSMPQPAVRIVVGEGGQVAHALGTARRDLIDRAMTPRGADAAAHVNHRDMADRAESPRLGHAGHEPGDHQDEAHPSGPQEHMDDRSEAPTGEHGTHEHGEHEVHADEHCHGAHHDSSPPAAPDGQGHDDHGMDHGHGGHAAHSGHEGDASHQPADHATHMDHMGHHRHGGHMDHMGHDMHTMGEVAGLPMAERADDRDELRLDQLHVPFGPGLSDWPAGLVLRLTLQGDVVQGVEVDRLPGVSGHRLPFWDEPWLRAAHGEDVTRGGAVRRRCAAHLDSAGRLLAVVGWDDVAVRCRRLRDELLSGASHEGIGGDLRRTLHRIGRSRPLRWSIAGLGELSADRARAAGVTGPALAADGDAYDRLLMWLSEVERGLEGLDDTRPLAPDDRTGPRGRLDGPRPPSQALLDVLPELLTGAEFACARIIVASLDPDLDELAPATVPGTARA